MAYFNKYRGGWGSSHNQEGYLYIDQLDLSADEFNPIKIVWDSITISYIFEDWNNPIVGMRAEFEIANDRTDFFELLPLLTAEEREYKIRIVATSPVAYTLFEGYLNCDTVTEKYLHCQSIRFVASSYLSKLENFHPVSIDTLQTMTFIDIIDEILRSAGAEYNIRVNAKIHAQGDELDVDSNGNTIQTLFNKNGFYTEVFWEDNVTRKSSLDTLKAILTSFDCYIYWWKGYWYIERYEDIWSESVDYVEYETGTTYSPIQTGSVINIINTITDVHALGFTDQSQTLAITPGLKKITVNLDDQRVMNLVLNDLTNAEVITTDLPEPAYRKFEVYEQPYSASDPDIVWSDFGLSHSAITNAVHRYLNTNVNLEVWRGLYTTFKVTVDDAAIELNIKFKYSIDKSNIYGWTGKWSDYTFLFNWYLRIADTNNYIVQSGEDWKCLTGNPTDPAKYVQSETTISGSSFDSVTKTAEVSITIPLGMVKMFLPGKDAGPLRGDQTFVFGLGIEKLQQENVDDAQIMDVWIGDVNITTSGTVQDNVIEGNVNTNFLNSKDISMLLYDMTSYNYKNGILRGDDLLIRTERWGTGTVGNILERGVCWNTSHNPTISNNHTSDGIGFGLFVSIITGLTEGTTYYVRAYVTTTSGTIYGNEQTFATIVLAIGTYHQGGKIFYFLQPGEANELYSYDANVPHGLIAALTDQGDPNAFYTNFWASLTCVPRTCGATGSAIGTGKANTDLMDGSTCISTYAVYYCVNYEHDNYTDWYMPSIYELIKLRLVKNIIGGFLSAWGSWYWSSTECSNTSGVGDPPALANSDKRAWALNFMEYIQYTGVELTTNAEFLARGLMDYYDKNNHMRIRPIRSF
jgi:hypothetical protein